jgi:outer membrane receptor protein involved in Fe transport
LKKIIIPLFLFYSLSFYGNVFEESLPKNIAITGRIIDAENKEPIPYATVLLKKDLSDDFIGGITDEQGGFEIQKVPEGKYLVDIQFIGYQSYNTYIEITADSSDLDMGTIELQEITENLTEVEIRAETSTVVQKIDRKVINIGKDLTSAGASAAEIMNNIQSVSVDKDGNISLRGNSNVRILVDGRPTNISPSQLLQQIPSTSIKSIELITNPSAKYNPEGMSGIINIVLNKNANLGFNGNVNAGVTVGENVRFNGSLDLNYRTEKLNFFANYGLNSGISENYGNVFRIDNNSTQDFEWDSDKTSHLLKTGVDYYINDQNTLSLFTVQNFFDALDTGSTMVTFLNGDFDNVHQINTTDLETKTQTYNLNFKHDFDKEGHNLEMEANFSITDSPENAVFQELNNPNDPILNYEDNIMNDRNNMTINIDYVNPLSESSKMELGLESRNLDMENARVTSQNQYIYDDNGVIIGTAPIDDTKYEYNTDIYSAYATYTKEFKKLTMQLGGRLESYYVEAIYNGEKIFEDDYITLYPSAFITYKSTEKNQFQVSFSRRVDRPGFSQVNPIREWSTPQITSVGNPELRPQFTNSIELNYTRTVENGSFTFGTFYRIINDNITRVVYEDPLDENKVILSFNNTDDNSAYGFEASTNYNFTEWWDTNISFDIYNQTEKGVIGTEELEVQNVTWNFRMNNNFEIVKNLRLQWFTMYRGANKGLQFDNKPMWKMDIGARLNLFDGKGTLSARYSDIFNTMFWAFDTENPYPATGDFHWESQTWFIGFSYRYGSDKIKSRSRKNRNGNENSGGGFL